MVWINILCFVGGLVLGVLAHMAWSWATDITDKAKLTLKATNWTYKKLGGTGSAEKDLKKINDKMKNVWK